MAKKAEKSRSAVVVVTANRLRDGRVVWYGAADQWVEHIADASVFTGAEEEQALGRAREWERREVVVNAYPVAVETDDAQITPVTVRERVRAVGPSVRPDLSLLVAAQP